MSEAVTDIREQRRITHENLRSQLCLRSYTYATVAEVDESNACTGRCTASYVSRGGLKTRVVVVGDSGCPVHLGGVV